MRITMRAIVMISLLVAAVLVLNTLVGATDHSNMSQHDMHNSGMLSDSDRKFVMEAAHGGMMEVELGRLATQKAGSEDVKQFGQRMVDDHSKANDELMTLASRKGIMIPKPEDHHAMGSSGGTSNTDHSAMEKIHQKMMKEHQKLMAKLSPLSGAAFDREYMKMMVEDHMKDVAAFEKEAARGDDADLKSWAASKLPTLKEHLQLARETNAKVKGKTGMAGASK